MAPLLLVKYAPLICTRKYTVRSTTMWYIEHNARPALLVKLGKLEVYSDEAEPQ